MKLKLILILLIFYNCTSCKDDISNAFIIDGEITGLADYTNIELSYLVLNNDEWKKITDTTSVLDGKFFFQGNINELTAASLRFENIDICFYIEPTIMKLELDKNRAWEYKLSGTTIEQESIILKDKIKSNEKELYDKTLETNHIVEQINIKTEESSYRDSLIYEMLTSIQSIKDLQTNIAQIKLRYIIENKQSPIAPHLIYTLLQQNIINNDTLKYIYSSLPENSKKTLLGQIAYKQIEKNEKIVQGKNITKGSIVPDFITKDISENSVQLSELYKQNYILIDFWASWCIPCLKQVPQIQYIHDNYNNKGLTILGISLDEDTEKWKSAVVKYKLNSWRQILDNIDSSFFSDNISDAFGVKQIPAYFLIDSNGNILEIWQHIGDEEIKFIDNLFSDLDVNSK